MICSGVYRFLFILTSFFQPRLCQNTNIKSGPGFGGQVRYLITMPTKKPILNFAADEELLKRISDFRFENRIETRSEAIRILVEEGLKRLKGKRKK